MTSSLLPPPPGALSGPSRPDGPLLDPMSPPDAPSSPAPARGLSRLGGIGLLLLGLAGGAGGALLLRPRAAAPPAAKKQTWQCPMHPEILQDHPGDCPLCGMPLVVMDGAPAAAGGTDTHAAVTIDLARQQLIGLRTARAEEGPAGGDLRASGRVAVDETRVRRTHVKVEGWIEKLFVDYTGRTVARGEPLFSVYSPEFVSAQKELLLALRTRGALGEGLREAGGELLEAARRRLRAWDVPEEALERLERTGEVQRAITLRSPIAGVVTARTATEGARVTPADVPFEITDLGSVWIVAEVYESELARVGPGTPAQATLEAFPGRTFQGRVAFVDPVLDPRTRTARVRLEVPNPGGLLKPEMFAEVVLRSRARRGLLVPLDAVVDSGTSKVVFVSLGDGRFEPREVVLGATAGERVEVRSGLKADEEVVVRAAFLVDSESRLKAALAHLVRDGKKGD